jgi:hypothetical protein
MEEVLTCGIVPATVWCVLPAGVAWYQELHVGIFIIDHNKDCNDNNKKCHYYLLGCVSMFMVCQRTQCSTVKQRMVAWHSMRWIIAVYTMYKYVRITAIHISHWHCRKYIPAVYGKTAAQISLMYILYVYHSCTVHTCIYQWCVFITAVHKHRCCTYIYHCGIILRLYLYHCCTCIPTVDISLRLLQYIYHYYIVSHISTIYRVHVPLLYNVHCTNICLSFDISHTVKITENSRTINHGCDQWMWGGIIDQSYQPTVQQVIISPISPPPLLSE